MVRAQFLSSCTLCARFLSCAALCQPAPCSHPPPTSLGRALPTTASRSTAPSALCSRECTKLTGAALIIATLNGATLNRTTRNGTSIDAVSLCRLWLTEPVSCQVAVADSHAFASRPTPPRTRACLCTAVPHVVSGAVRT